MRSARNRPIRIAGASGSASDRRHAILSLAQNHPTDPIDVITGDWLSEANMSVAAGKKVDGTAPAYEASFLEALEPALPYLARYRIKLAVNAGASDTKGLYDVVQAMVTERKLELKVAYITGDECLPALLASTAPSAFPSLSTGKPLAEWGFTPLYAQAYLGGLGIAAALSAGADIVLCGRVSDASPVIGAAAWWHGWTRADRGGLANALVAGHLIECSTYVCGGNYSGFTALPGFDAGVGGWADVGFPIAEIGAGGEVAITKQRGTAGAVTVGTCTAQLLYEIQGPVYHNADISADLRSVSFHELAPNRVAVSGVLPLPPPPTTKVGVTARGGYQAEVTWYIVGPNPTEKAALLESQIRHLLRPHAAGFAHLSFQLLGGPSQGVGGPRTTQNAATLPLRIVAQSRTAAALAPGKFLRPCLDPIMATYPGGTFNLDLRPGFPMPVWEYHATLLPQPALTHAAHLPFHADPEKRELVVPPPRETGTYPPTQPSDPAPPGPPGDFGPTRPVPLHTVLGFRSGDKSSDCSLGVFLLRPSPAAYNWLRTTFTTQKLIELLADDYKGAEVRRWEFPGTQSVVFLLRDFLDRGVGCTAGVDFLGKGVGEWVGGAVGEVPVAFLDGKGGEGGKARL